MLSREVSRKLRDDSEVLTVCIITAIAASQKTVIFILAVMTA
jgi:hypothetical protein